MTALASWTMAAAKRPSFTRWRMAGGGNS
jgi:hypothetical protein